MTLTQIGEIAGCGERTVRRHAKKLFPDKVFTGKGGANLSDIDSVQLMTTLPKRNMVSGQMTGQMTAQIGAIVRETVSAMMPAMVQAFRLAQAGEPVPLKLAAPIASRDELRRIINKAARASGDYSGEWDLLYEEIYYRLHRNVKECARNRGIRPIDYIEAEGILSEVIAIAREIFA